jgi:uncharacterized protein (DUF2141 family)
VAAGVVLSVLGTSASAGNLRIVVSNLGGNKNNDKGSVIVQVYDRADRWLSDEVYLRQSQSVAGARTGDIISLELSLPAGEYALSVFHDVDGDGRMARNFFGLPKEPAGLSNNAVPRFGPPKWKDARFELRDKPVTQRIRLN